MRRMVEGTAASTELVAAPSTAFGGPPPPSATGEETRLQNQECT
jgi:hypothetical protein